MMAPQGLAPKLSFSEAPFAAKYNHVPFGFNHNLHHLSLFRDEELRHLCEIYRDSPQDFFVSRSAASAGTPFYSVPLTPLKPDEAFDQLTIGSYKILLKRLERYHPGFRDLLSTLYGQVKEELRRGGFCDQTVRLESSIFISAAESTTPFHFDPEVNFFSQIEGEKTYHLYEPAALGEDEVEPLYVRATVDIGQVDLARRDPATEHVFRLVPGAGLHQPQDSPHWVRTMGDRSVSYTFVYETEEGRHRARVRSFNHYLRRVNIAPLQPGEKPFRDALKAATMAAAIPVRQQIGKALRTGLRR